MELKVPDSEPISGKTDEPRIVRREPVDGFARGPLATQVQAHHPIPPDGDRGVSAASEELRRFGQQSVLKDKVTSVGDAAHFVYQGTSSRSRVAYQFPADDTPRVLIEMCITDQFLISTRHDQILARIDVTE